MEGPGDPGESESRGIIKNQIKKMRESRNELVHGGLFELPGLTTSTTKGIENTIHYLDEQYRDAEQQYRFVAQQVLGWMTACRMENPQRSPDFEQLYRLMRTYVLSFTEWINLADPADTDWPNTRIVKLLRLAEIRTPWVDAWITPSEGDTPKPTKLTLLSRAGKFVKSEDKACTPKAYGLKTLKEVLVISGVFDVWEAEVSERQGAVLAYKSKIPVGDGADLAEPFVDQVIFGA